MFHQIYALRILPLRYKPSSDNRIEHSNVKKAVKNLKISETTTIRNFFMVSKSISFEFLDKCNFIQIVSLLEFDYINTNFPLYMSPPEYTPSLNMSPTKGD